MENMDSFVEKKAKTKKSYLIEKNLIDRFLHINKSLKFEDIKQELSKNRIIASEPKIYRILRKWNIV